MTTERAPSVAATKVMQCTDIRELLQTFIDYPENSSFPATCYLRGGWRFAHLSKLYNYDRSKLIGKVHEYSVDDFIAYLQLRIAYLVSSKVESYDDHSQRRVDKLTLDFPVVAKQFWAWTLSQADKIVLSEEEADKKQLSFLCSLMEQVLLIREGMLRSLRPGGQIDRIVRATQEYKEQVLSGIDRLMPVICRISENIKRAAIRIADAELKKECEETLAYIESVRGAHGENLRVFFDAAVTKVQQQQELVGKNEPPPPLPGTAVIRSISCCYLICAISSVLSHL